MVDELLQWNELAAELDIRLSQTFSPATAIDRKDFFHGRNALMRRLIDAANQSGQHAIVYGERGVGKTSLANVLSDFLQPYTSEVIAAAKVNCYRDVTYSRIWHDLFRQINIRTAAPPDDLSLGNVIDTLREDDSRKFILIVDEFDRIEDPDIDTAFAETIKVLSDFNMDTTIVLVGVADDVDDLIAEHESVNRCLIQIHLPRMPFDELKEILAAGMRNTDMEISDEAMSQICSVSLGLPHYVHSLGLASGRSAIDDRRRNVETPDVKNAMSALILESQQTILRGFEMATDSPRRQNYYFQVLLACALAKTDRLGYFRPSNVRLPYSRIMGEDHSISSFSKHLHGLCGDDRGAALQKFGETRNYRFRFSDPMMQPYALIRGIESGLLGIDEISAMTDGGLGAGDD